MRRIINHIHSKPTHHRRRISMQLSLGITAIVFIAWLVTLPLRLSQTQPNNLADSGASSLVAGVAAAGSELQNQFGQLKAQFSGSGSQTQTQTSAQTPAVSAPATSLSGAPINQTVDSSQ